MSLEMYLASDHPLTEKSEDAYSLDNRLPQDEQYWIWPREKPYWTQSRKRYFADFDWNGYTSGRARSFIRYLKMQLTNVREIEIWKTWDDNKPFHPISITEFEIDVLRPEDIGAFIERNIDQGRGRDPIDHCCVIKR